MLYRIISDTTKDVWDAATGALIERTHLGGIVRSGAAFAKGASLAGLPSPQRIENLRVRFYFTEHGWRVYGRPIVRAAVKEGRVVRVIRRKQPARSQMVYQDEFQVALLPTTRGDRQQRANRRVGHRGGSDEQRDT